MIIGGKLGTLVKKSHISGEISVSIFTAWNNNLMNKLVIHGASQSASLLGSWAQLELPPSEKKREFSSQSLMVWILTWLLQLDNYKTLGQLFNFSASVPSAFKNVFVSLVWVSHLAVLRASSRLCAHSSKGFGNQMQCQGLKWVIHIQGKAFPIVLSFGLFFCFEIRVTAMCASQVIGWLRKNLCTGPGTMPSTPN